MNSQIQTASISELPLDVLVKIFFTEPATLNIWNNTCTDFASIIKRKQYMDMYYEKKKNNDLASLHSFDGTCHLEEIDMGMVFYIASMLGYSPNIFLSLNKHFYNLFLTNRHYCPQKVHLVEFRLFVSPVLNPYRYPFPNPETNRITYRAEERCACIDSACPSCGEHLHEEITFKKCDVCDCALILGDHCCSNSFVGYQSVMEHFHYGFHWNKTTKKFDQCLLLETECVICSKMSRQVSTDIFGESDSELSYDPDDLPDSEYGYDNDY